MVADGSKSRISSAPPHELNVRKFAESRASELQSLQSIISHRLNSDFRSQRNKRKRTTGHDDRVARKKRFRKKGTRVSKDDVRKNDSSNKDEKKISRRVRRRIELKKTLESGFGASGDGTKRLRTHIWHAKRFTMSKLWGFHIPLGLHGRGRGSRSLLKKLRNGVLVHDASYYGTVQLEGPQGKLMSILSSVLVPSPSACSEEILSDILSGNICGSAMLHHIGETCFGCIAPVTYVWRPLQQNFTNTESLSASGFNERSTNDDTTLRQVWVWIHAAAFREAYEALRLACENQMDATGCSVQCTSLEGQLAKLELTGSKAFQLLQKTLVPSTCISKKSCVEKCSMNNENSEPDNSSIFENDAHSSSYKIFSFVVKDPRENKEQILNKRETESEIEYRDLWDASKEMIYPPVEESVLCTEKHHSREEFFRIGQKRSRTQNASSQGRFSRVCPILLIKNEKCEGSLRCSIILPLSWVKAFWITFISNGAHAIGLREKHWIACETGLPFFPFDFPDCEAYSNAMAMEAIDTDQKAMLRPPSKRPLKVPIPPPWNCIQLNLQKISNNGPDSHNKVEESSSKIDNCGKNSQNGTSDNSILDSHDVPFKGFVARTPCMLSDFLKKIGPDRLLLFPRVSDQNNSINNFMINKEFLTQNEAITSEVKCRTERCFVRVLLHAYKEGVFEQGAVICAPNIDDILLLTDRSGLNDRQLHMPQSSLSSYFVELPCGKWELQVPEEPSLKETYRSPVGFITTGFVRGSKKPTASGLCEASLLSKLREEQWNAFPVKQRKKEIYVLVRNMRSTAYRLAMATIVLEQQEQDTNFI